MSDQPTPNDPVGMPASPPYGPRSEPPRADQWPPIAPGPPPPAPPAPDESHSPRRSSKQAVTAVIVVVSLLCAAFGYGVGSSVARSSGGRSSRVAGSTSTTREELPSPASTNGSQSGSLSTSDITAKVEPSIVDINVTFLEGSGAGTGIVLTSNGLVLTNNHVIADATKVEAESVTTGDSWPATVLGYDITDDVALLQLQDASGLTPVSVADSDSVTVGQEVVALGNALGRGGTPAISPGTVSQLNQSIQVSNEDGSTSTLSGLIETSAELQPGDSGGPLVDTSGAVIGMDVAATTSRRGRTTNDSFAVPINTALDVARQIQSGQASTRIHVGERALLGVQASDGESATVAQVEPDSPAAKAGLEPGDTITAVDGHAVSSVSDIIAALDAHHPGDSVAVTWVDTSGQRHGASVKLVAGPPA